MHFVKKTSITEWRKIWNGLSNESFHYNLTPSVIYILSLLTFEWYNLMCVCLDV